MALGLAAGIVIGFALARWYDTQPAREVAAPAGDIAKSTLSLQETGETGRAGEADRNTTARQAKCAITNKEF